MTCIAPDIFCRHLKNASVHGTVYAFNEDGTLKNPELLIKNLHKGKWKQVNNATSMAGQKIIQ
jgi:hypothetical protein